MENLLSASLSQEQEISRELQRRVRDLQVRYLIISGCESHIPQKNLISIPFINYDLDRRKIVSFSASKILLLHMIIQLNLLDLYPFFFSKMQQFPYSTFTILHLSLTQSLKWKLFISSVAKPASLGLSILYHIQHFSSLMLVIYKGLVSCCIDFAFCCIESFTNTAF